MQQVSKQTWHHRLCHLGTDRLNHLIRNNMADRLTISSSNSMPSICEPCIVAKQHQHLFPKNTQNCSNFPLQPVVVDLHGPLPVCTASGHRYWICFTDDCTTYREAYLLKSKDKAFDAYLDFEAHAENQTNQKIQTFRDDKGGEFIGQKWDTHFKTKGITHKQTTKGTLQQNGIAEQTNWTLTEGVIAMLQQARLPTSFWGDALRLLI